MHDAPFRRLLPRQLANQRLEVGHALKIVFKNEGKFDALVRHALIDAEMTKIAGNLAIAHAAAINPAGAVGVVKRALRRAETATVDCADEFGFKTEPRQQGAHM